MTGIETLIIALLFSIMGGMIVFALIIGKIGQDIAEIKKKLK